MLRGSTLAGGKIFFFFSSFCFVFPWPIFGTVSGNKRIIFLADNSQKVVTSMERYMLHIFSFLSFGYRTLEIQLFRLRIAVNVIFLV